MKKIIIISIFTILILSSCSSLGSLKEEQLRNIDNDDLVRYFPEEAGISEFANEWYSTQLSALGEPVIYVKESNTDETIYRFICLRTFHEPFSIRIEVDEESETARLFFKMCDGAGGYEPGNLIMSNESALEGNEVENLIKAIEENDYWDMPFEGGAIGADGSIWIVEGLKNGEYKAISKWTPTNTTSYSYYSDGSIAGQHNPDDSEIGIYNLGNLFIKLSEQTIEDLY